MKITAKPNNFEKAENWIFDKAVTHEYDDIDIVAEHCYRTFWAITYRTGATGYYRGQCPSNVLKGLRVLDALTGLELSEDLNEWAMHINAAQRRQVKN